MRRTIRIAESVCAAFIVLSLMLLLRLIRRLRAALRGKDQDHLSARA